MVTIVRCEVFSCGVACLNVSHTIVIRRAETLAVPFFLHVLAMLLPSTHMVAAEIISIRQILVRS